MTQYSDVPQVNDLYTEHELVDQAIAMLGQDGGGVTNMTIAGPPPIVGPDAPPPQMPVRVTVPIPNSPDLVTEVQAWLNQRLIDLEQQLTALGVTTP